MTKTCATCLRENDADAFQCFACRSRSFVGQLDHSAQYLQTQKQLKTSQKQRALEEAIEGCRQFPGYGRKLPIAVSSLVALAVGAPLYSWTIGKMIACLGIGGLCWLAGIYRTETTVYFLESRLKSRYTAETKKEA